MKRKFLRSLLLTSLVCSVLSVLSSVGHAWEEDTFYSKTIIIARPFTLPQGPTDMRAQTIVGSPREYTVQKKDTLLDIARYFDLGYNELIDVYPDMDPWLPPVGETLTLPTFWILPKSRYEGVVVNIPEMRLYYFPPRKRRNAAYGGDFTRRSWPRRLAHAGCEIQDQWEDTEPGMGDS